MKAGNMGFISQRRYRYLSHSPAVEALLKEFFRKSIHICAAFVPLFAKISVSAVCVFLVFSIIAYSVCELLRMRGVRVPIISRITCYAARGCGCERFELGPITLAAGILFALLIFPHQYSSVGILALALGDGTASLAGKLFGKRKLAGTSCKTLEGSLACFCMVFLSSLAITKNFFYAIFLALSAAVFEALPLKDYDNLIIPLLISFLAALLDSFSAF